MLPDLPAGWPGYLIGVLGVLFPFVVHWRRGNIDQSARVLEEWQKLYDKHEKRIEQYEGRIEQYEQRIEAITKQFSEHRDQASREIDGLRVRLSAAEKRIQQLESTIVEKDKYIAGLEAQIGQITQSSAVILSGNHASDDIAGAASRSAETKGQGRKRRDDRS